MNIAYLGSTQMQNMGDIEVREAMADLNGIVGDVCVVAGDLNAPLTNSISTLEEIAKRMPVVYVPGNLDFYKMGVNSTPMEKTLRDCRELADRIGNIHLLQNRSVEIDGVKFIGATMWADLWEEDAAPYTRLMNDFRAITTEEGAWTIARQNREHRISRDFVVEELQNRGDVPAVVVTHLQPHPSLTLPRYATEQITQFYENDFDDVLSGNYAPEFWVHGATSQTSDVLIGKTRCLANNKGHPHRVENPDFTWAGSFTVDVAPSPKHSAPRI